MFVGHWFSRSGDINYLICHLTSKDYVIKKLRDFMGGSYSFCGTTLTSLVAIDIAIAEI